MDRALVTGAFERYASGYDAEAPKIRLKIDHTYRVAALCERIAGAVDGADPGLAWLCGMLHDIGRFEQVRRYDTFLDAVSVDHAMLGADLLFRDGLGDAFGLDALPPGDLRVLESAIRNHGGYRIADGLSAEERMYCHILRDADKIDIFRVDCTNSMEAVYGVTAEALRASPVTEAVKDCFRRRTTVLRTLKRTPADFIVAHLCLYFELVYPVSRDIAREQGYIDKMLAFESDNADTRAWFETMRDTLWG